MTPRKIKTQPLYKRVAPYQYLPQSHSRYDQAYSANNFRPPSPYRDFYVRKKYQSRRDDDEIDEREPLSSFVTKPRYKRLYSSDEETEKTRSPSPPVPTSASPSPEKKSRKNVSDKKPLIGEPLPKKSTFLKLRSKEEKDLNIYGFTDEQIDEMVDNGCLIMAKPEQKGNRSASWEKGLRILQFDDGEVLENWFRCSWCGKNFNLIRETGTTQMSKHIDTHLRGRFCLMLSELANALSLATDMGRKYGHVDESIFVDNLPVKNKHDKSIKW